MGKQARLKASRKQNNHKQGEYLERLVEMGHKAIWSQLISWRLVHDTGTHIAVLPVEKYLLRLVVMQKANLITPDEADFWIFVRSAMSVTRQDVKS